MKFYGVTMRTVLRVGAILLLTGCAPTLAASPPPPSADLSLELVDSDGNPLRPVAEGEVLDRGALVRFVVDVKSGDYLHLLQRNGRGISALYPSTGLVWMRPDGVERLVPQPPYLQEEEQQVGFNGEDGGRADYLLVVAAAPRPVPADSWLPDLDTFLAGAPYLEGPMASPGTVVDTFAVVWGAEAVDPEEPRSGGRARAAQAGDGDDPPEEGAGEDSEEVGGEGDGPDSEEVGGEGDGPDADEVGGEGDGPDADEVGGGEDP